MNTFLLDRGLGSSYFTSYFTPVDILTRLMEGLRSLRRRPGAVSFDAVLKAEIEEIEKSRAKRWSMLNAPKKKASAEPPSGWARPVGFAFSRAGIRTATF